MSKNFNLGSGLSARLSTQITRESNPPLTAPALPVKPGFQNRSFPPNSFHHFIKNFSFFLSLLHSGFPIQDSFSFLHSGFPIQDFFSFSHSRLQT